jgi:cytochrome P450
MFWLFAVAGNEKLRNGLPGRLIALLQHPGQLAALCTDPFLLPGAVDEMLCWWTPVMVFRRTATRDVEVAGIRMRAGDKVAVSFTSANRVPRSRSLRRPPRALSAPILGHGPHFRLGGRLARVQMRALFGGLLRRTEHLGLDGSPALLRPTFQRGLKRLPLRWVVAG